MSKRLVQASRRISLISSRFPKDAIIVDLPPRPAKFQSDFVHQSPFKNTKHLPFSVPPLLILLRPTLPLSVVCPTEPLSWFMLYFVIWLAALVFSCRLSWRQFNSDSLRMCLLHRQQRLNVAKTNKCFYILLFLSDKPARWAWVSLE